MQNPTLVVIVAATVVLCVGVSHAQPTQGAQGSNSSPQSIGTLSQTRLAANAQAKPPSALAGTSVQIEFTQIISSKSNKRGDLFSLRLAKSVVVDGQVLLPAGLKGMGQVIDAQPAGLLGNPAKLVLAARYLDTADGRLPLRTLKFGVTGQDNTTAVFAASMIPYAGLGSFLIKGGNIDIPVGSHADAKLAAAFPLAEVPSPPAPSASPAPTHVPSETDSNGSKP